MSLITWTSTPPRSFGRSAIRRKFPVGLFVSCCMFALLAAASARAETPSFRLRWEYATGKDLPMSAVADEARHCLYVAVKSGGLLVLDDASGARLATVSRDQLGGLDAMYVVQQGEEVFVALGDFFNAGGDRAGLAIVNVRDPKAPTVTSAWATPDKVKGATSVLVDGNSAYLGAMTRGVFILDVSARGNPRLVSVFTPDPDYPRRNPSRIQAPNVRGFAIRGNTLFVADDSGGIRTVDVSDKAHPHEIGRYINPVLGGIPKQQAFNNLVLDGPYAYAATDYCGMEVVDIRDPAAMKQAGWWNPWHCEEKSNMWFDSGGHTNQIALDAARHLVFLSAGKSELEVVDVSDPHRPALAAHYGDPKKQQGTWGMTLSDHNVYLDYIITLIPFRGTWAGVRALAR